MNYYSFSPCNMPIGMAYVPWQKWGNLYDVEQGLYTGTIFNDLDKPYEGGCFNAKMRM